MIERMRLDDVLHMELREVDITALCKAEDWLADILDRMRKGISYTIYHDKTPIACAGIIPIYPGVAEVWALTGKLVNKYPLAFHKACKKIVAEALESNHRVQCTVEASYDKSVKWIEALGFEREGTLRGFNAYAEDYYMYSIIREV